MAFKGSKAAGLGYINDTLMRRVWDEAFTLYGLIAEYADMPEDRSSITFYINPNAKFHDGSFITREDVLFSLETFQTKGTPNQKKTYGKVTSTEMIGTNGIKMNFINNEDKELPLIVAGFLPIIPKKYYSEIDAVRIGLGVGFIAVAIGTWIAWGNAYAAVSLCVLLYSSLALIFAPKDITS